MKVKMPLSRLFMKIHSAKYQRVGGASIRIEEITSGVNKGALLVMFPPTGYKENFFKGASSWLWNFAAWCLPYRDMKRPFFVHAGFMALYRDVREYLFERVEEYMELWSARCRMYEDAEEHKIIVAGYSQGAALATIAYEDLFFHGFDVCGIVFASPRVFVGAPKKRFKNLHRIEVHGDIVTRLPFWPYSHIGKRSSLGILSDQFCIEKHYMSSYLSELHGVEFDETRGGC